MPNEVKFDELQSLSDIKAGKLKIINVYTILVNCIHEIETAKNSKITNDEFVHYVVDILMNINATVINLANNEIKVLDFSIPSHYFDTTISDRYPLITSEVKLIYGHILYELMSFVIKNNNDVTIVFGIDSGLLDIKQILLSLITNENITSIKSLEIKGLPESHLYKDIPENKKEINLLLMQVISSCINLQALTVNFSGILSSNEFFAFLVKHVPKSNIRSLNFSSCPLRNEQISNICSIIENPENCIQDLDLECSLSFRNKKERNNAINNIAKMISSVNSKIICLNLEQGNGTSSVLYKDNLFAILDAIIINHANNRRFSSLKLGHVQGLESRHLRILISLLKDYSPMYCISFENETYKSFNVRNFTTYLNVQNSDKLTKFVNYSAEHKGLATDFNKEPANPRIKNRFSLSRPLLEERCKFHIYSCFLPHIVKEILCNDVVNNIYSYLFSEDFLELYFINDSYCFNNLSYTEIGHVISVINRLEQNNPLKEKFSQLLENNSSHYEYLMEIKYTIQDVRPLVEILRKNSYTLIADKIENVINFIAWRNDKHNTICEEQNTNHTTTTTSNILEPEPAKKKAKV